MNKKLKIALIVPELLPVPAVEGGGPEKITQMLAIEFSKSNFFDQVDVFSVSPKKKINFESNNNLNFKWVKINNYLNKLTANHFIWNTRFYGKYYIKKVIKQMNPVDYDIIHIHNRSQLVFDIRKAYPNAIIYLHLNNEYLHKNVSRPLSDKMIIKIGKNVDKIVCSSNFIANGVIKANQNLKPKIEVILNGVDLNEFDECIDKVELRNKLFQDFVKKGDTVFLFCGRLVEEKGALILVKAALEFAKIRNDFKFIFLGSHFYGNNNKTEYIKEIEKTFLEIKDICLFTGQVSREMAPSYYSASDVFVFPALWDDPSPLVIYEAMACNLPIISTKSGGVPEIVGESNSAIWINKLNTKDLIDSINFIISNNIEFNKMKNGREYISKNATFEIMALKFIDSFKNIRTNV